MSSHVRILLHQYALQVLDLPFGVLLVHLPLGRWVVVHGFITLALVDISLSQLPVLLFGGFKSHVLANVHRVDLVVGHYHRLIRRDNLHILTDHILFNLRCGVQLLK